MTFLIGLGCFCNCCCNLFLLLITCLHIVINHSIICAKLINLPYITFYFSGATYIVLCGIDNALLASAIVIPSSQNIIASLCCWSVDQFIHEVTILKYDCKLVLNTIVKKLSMAGIYKPSTFEFVIVNLHLVKFFRLHIFQLHVYLLVILNLLMTFAKCLCKFRNQKIRKFLHVLTLLGDVGQVHLVFH